MTFVLDLVSKVPKEERMRRVFAEAKTMARNGYGWEDIYVKLKDEGVTGSIARGFVFGKGK